DLARIVKTIRTLPVPITHREFFYLCLASIIRNSSNADPVPVSGLEVTSHMRKKDEAGRLIDPFALMMRSVRDGLVAVTAFAEKVHDSVYVKVRRADVLQLSK